MEKGANEESIAVQRPQKGRIVVDLLSAAKRGMPEKDIRLQPGDVVYVPLSVW
jgi:ribosomal protein L16 Arg81 hydroxylase